MDIEHSFIYLFDESGRAILSTNDSHIFLGCGVFYDEKEEENIFNTCDKLFNLSASKPLKNENINDELALKIVEKIIELNIPVVCIWIDLNDGSLISVIKNYRELTIELKKHHRLPGSRKIAHILHDKILDKNIFEILDFLSNINNVTIRLKPYIDEWSIPKLERNVKLINRSQSIEDKISEITNLFNQNILFKVDNFQLLKNAASKKKRFIDVITSAVSRAFKKVEKTKYICDSSNILSTNSSIKFIDYTKEIVSHINRITDNFLKDNPVI